MNHYTFKTLDYLYNQLDDEVWNNLKTHGNKSEMTKESLIDALFKKEQTKLYRDATINCIGKEAKINLSKYKKNIQCEIGEPPQNAIGWMDYTNHKMILKEDIYCDDSIENIGYKAYYMLMHELRHDFQKNLLSAKNIIKNQVIKEYIDYLEAYLKGEKEINYFGLYGKGLLHINPYYQEDIVESERDANIDSLSHMFYNLNISEYDAFMFQQDSGDNSIDEQIFSNISLFMKRYNQTEFNEDYIVEQINKSILQIYNKLQPENDLQANIMYDICCLSLLEMNKKDPNCGITEKECAELLNLDVKRERLYVEGFLLVGEGTRIKNKIYLDNMNEKCFYSRMLDFENNKISNKELENNPRFVLYLASVLRRRDEECEYFRTERLRQYCIVKKDELCEKSFYKDGIIAIFGENFLEMDSSIDNGINNMSISNEINICSYDFEQIYMHNEETNEEESENQYSENQNFIYDEDELEI